MNIRPDAPPRWTETDRSQALASYGILDTDREADFDDLAQIASQVCGTPIAIVNLVDTRRQFFKAEVGLGVRETPLDTAFCVHAILADDVMMVPDAREDPRFDCNPLVTGAPGLRFYAGAVLRTAAGLPIGTMCVLDYVPRELDEGQLLTLRLLARQAMTQLDLRKALAQSRVIEARHRQIVDSAIDFAIVTSDLDGAITSWNTGAERILGWSAAEMIGNTADVFFTPEDEAAGVPEREMSTARALGRGADERWHLRKDGSRFWASGEMMLLKDDQDRHVGYLKILRDRTERREAEQRRTDLSHELSHRLKNSYAIVQAIVAQTFRTAKTLQEGRDAIAGRLQALSAAQDLLTQSNFDAADIAVVVEGALFAHRSGEATIIARGPPVRLNSDQGLGLSLALHELATNAVKYGALSASGGVVEISWDAAPDGRFRFDWVERGGPSVAEPERRGFGSRLVERMVAGYFGGTSQLRFERTGVAFHLDGIVAR